MGTCKMEIQFRQPSIMQICDHMAENQEELFIKDNLICICLQCETAKSREKNIVYEGKIR